LQKYGYAVEEQYFFKKLWIAEKNAVADMQLPSNYFFSCEIAVVD
jgi:hypothetical protein